MCFDKIATEQVIIILSHPASLEMTNPIIRPVIKEL